MSDPTEVARIQRETDRTEALRRIAEELENIRKILERMSK